MSDTEPVIFRGGIDLSAGMGALPTPSQLCLVRAAAGPVESIEQALAEWRAQVDLTGPIDGGSYRLIPTIFHRLQAAGIEDPNRGMFKGVYRRLMVENTRVLDAASQAVSALAAGGITPWLSKGAALVVGGYYPTLASRPMSDVDIVVESSLRRSATAILRSNGFTPALTERVMDHVNGAPFADSAGMQVDLHWHYLKHARSTEADEMIARRSQPVELDGIPALIPGPTGLLIITLVHGMISNAEPPVRWLVDAARILDVRGGDIAWDDVVEFAARFRLARRIERALEILAASTGHAAPVETTAALAAVRTSPVERMERRISTAPWNSARGRIVKVLADYAGGDRGLHHVPTGLPVYLSQRWNVEHVRQVPAVGTRKLIRWLRPGRQ